MRLSVVFAPVGKATAGRASFYGAWRLSIGSWPVAPYRGCCWACLALTNQLPRPSGRRSRKAASYPLSWSCGGTFGVEGQREIGVISHHDPAHQRIFSLRVGLNRPILAN